MNKIRTIFTILLPLLYSAAAFAGGPKQEFIKTLNREFDTDAKGTTALYNKYGKVNVNTWNKNQVKIDITIIVNATSQREADKTFERINVNFTNAWGYVKAETMIAQGSNGGWWPSENTCQDFKINYEIWMPAGNQLDLKNRYGNSWVGNLDGKLLAEIKYGDLRTESVNNDADLNLGYGKANMIRVNNLNGQVSYGELNLGEARDVQLDSKYSEIRVDKGSNLRMTSKYDDFNLGKIEELRLQTKYANLKIQSTRSAFITAQYTDLKFGSISDALDVDLSYGNLDISNLGRNFSEVNITGKYTTATVGVDKGTNYRFDAEAYNADVHYPNGANIRSRSDSGQREAVEGSMGDAGARAFVKARMHYGDFVLK